MYKIFVDAHVFDGEFQGTLTYIKELYLKILDSHSDVIIYFGANNICNVKKIFDTYSNVQYIEYSSKTSFSRIFIEIPRIINEIKCTHAHFQYIIPFKKSKECKYIVTIHDILFNDFPEEFSFLYRLKRNILFYLSAKNSDFLLTVSNYSKQKISEQYGIELDKIIVTPNAVSEEYFQFKSSRHESKYYIKKKYGVENFLLYVSRIEPRKNQTILLKAFIDEKLWENGFSLVFVGSNTLETELFELMQNLDENAKKNILWYEQVNHDDLKYFLKAAELFVYPSKAEGFGIPPLEAASLLTPVLCSNSTAMQDFIFFEPYMFNPNIYYDFRKLLLECIKNKNKIDLTLIQQSVKNKYSWSESANILFKGVFCK